MREVRDFDQFADELQRRQPRSILVEADRYLTGHGVPSWLEGYVGNYVHRLVYDVETARKHLLYGEELFTYFQTEYGAREAQLRSNRIGALLLAAEARVERLRLALPEIDIQVGNGRG